MSVKNNTEAGDNSTNLQAGGDCNVTINNNYFFNSAVDAAKRLLENGELASLPGPTQDIFQNNARSYAGRLADRSSNITKNGSDRSDIIGSPDFQLTYTKSIVSAGLSSSEEVHKRLAMLVVERINSDHDDLKRIVYNEAILVAEKLTVDQFKILTLCFLMKLAVYNGLSTLDQFHQWLVEKINPFLEFKRTQAIFKHLAYTGCASLSILNYDLAKLLGGKYPDVFGLNDPKLVLADNKIAKNLFSLWHETQLQNVELTSVGIVLATTYYEQITNQKLNVDLWIN